MLEQSKHSLKIEFGIRINTHLDSSENGFIINSLLQMTDAHLQTMSEGSFPRANR